MKSAEMLQGYGVRYSDSLDEMVEIRSEKGNLIHEVVMSNRARLTERPTTRHGRYGHGWKIAAPGANDSFPLNPRFTNSCLSKGNRTVELEHWLRDEEGRGSDEEEKEENSNQENTDINGTESKYREEVQRSETVVEEYENDAKAIVEETSPSLAVSTAESEDCFQHLISPSKRSASHKLQGIQAVKKIKATERQVSHGNLRDTFQMRSIYTISGSKTDSELKKTVENHLKTTASDETASPGKATYEEWLREKLNEEREKRRKQKENEKKEKKAREERRKEAERNYEIWKQRNDEAIREKRRTEKEKAEALAKEKMEEMNRKKEEAAKMFQAWKSDRMLKLAKEHKERMRNTEIDELKRKQELKDRNDEAQKAFNEWYKKNKIRNEEEQRKCLKSRRMEQLQNMNTKEYKEALAREAYDVWLQIKESERHFNESLQGRIMKFDEMFSRSHLVPWIPPSNIVPRQFVSTGITGDQSVKRFIKFNQTYKRLPSSNHRSKSAHK